VRNRSQRLRSEQGRTGRPGPVQSGHTRAEAYEGGSKGGQTGKRSGRSEQPMRKGKEMGTGSVAAGKREERMEGEKKKKKSREEEGRKKRRETRGK